MTGRVVGPDGEVVKGTRIHLCARGKDGALVEVAAAADGSFRLPFDPDRLAGDMAATGLPLDAGEDDDEIDAPIAAALRLAERITGRLPVRADLTGPLLTADLGPW